MNKIEARPERGATSLPTDNSNLVCASARECIPKLDRALLVTDPCRMEDDEAFRRLRRRSKRVAAVALTIGVLLAVAVAIFLVLAFRASSGP